MPEHDDNPETPQADEAVSESGEPAIDEKPSYPPITRDAPWSQVWQLPVLLLGLGLLALGVWVAIPSSEGPDVDGMLDEIAMLLDADNLLQAEEQLEKAEDHAGIATRTQQGRIWSQFGDLNFLQLNKADTAFVEPKVLQETRQSIVSYYRQAEEAKPGKESAYRLKPFQVSRLAETLVAMGRDDEALALLDRLLTEPAERRYAILRRMIERQVNGPETIDYTELATLFERFREELRNEEDADKALKQTVWVTTINAQLWLDADPSRAAEFLNRHIMRLKSLGLDKELAPLYVMLARAQQAQNRYDAADQTFAYAGELLPPNDALRADVMVGQAQLRLARGPAADETTTESLHAALNLFKVASEEYPSEPAFIDALIGRADVESRLGQHAQAREHFTLAVEELLRQTPTWDRRRAKLTDVIESHAQKASEQNAYDRALALLSHLRPLHPNELPSGLLLQFATIHDQIAEQHRENAVGTENNEPTPEARKMHNQEAAIHFGKSARYFRDYARRVTQTDDKAHGDALWRAAHNFDRAQLWSDAIAVYQQFVDERQEDHRLLQAQHLLGKAYLTDGQHAAAVEKLRKLVREHPKGRWTYESLVPLAQGLAATDQLAAARKVLIDATTDHPGITPDSAIYQAALIELGRLNYEAGRENPEHYVKAIETLTEAVRRFGDSEHGPTLRYLLADANRQSIVTIETKLKEQRAQRELIALQAERLRRLEESQIYFNQVITELEDRGESTLSPLELTYLRNSYFFQADCAFDRSRFEEAITLYDEAAKRWERHPSSLVAHVQIVNAYCELGRYDAAKRANQKALWALERLPDEVFEDPTLPMTRRHWEDWLRWTSELDLFGAQANAR